MTKRRERGSGSIRERNGRWRAAYFVVDADGKRRQRSATHPTKTEAREWLRDQLAKAAQGVTSDERTLGDWLGEWLESRSVSKLAPATRLWYRSAVEGHIRPYLGHIPLQKLTAAQLEAFYTDREERGRLDGKGGLGAASVRGLHVTLYRALESATRKRLLESNPAQWVEKKPTVGRVDLSEKAWTPDQLRTFLTSVTGDRLEVLWHVAALTGLRRGELCGLRWQDVDLDRGKLHIRQTWILVGGSPQLSKPKTDLSRRSVDLDSLTLAALKRHKAQQNEERLQAGEVWQDYDLVFCAADGRPLRPDSVSVRFGKLVKRSGLPKLRFHGLRHTHATSLLAAGVNPKIVQERLGHYSAAFTLDAYSSVVEGLQREAAEGVAALVFDS